MRRILGLLLVLGVILVGAGVLALRSARVQDGLVARAARRVIGRNTSNLLSRDALRILLCGTSSPIPSPRRAEACTAIFAGGKLWIVDTGPGSWRTLALHRIRGEAIAAVLYTHLHSDHIGELGEFNLQTWVAGRPGPLRVYGPDGVTDVVEGFPGRTRPTPASAPRTTAPSSCRPTAPRWSRCPSCSTARTRSACSTRTAWS